MIGSLLLAIRVTLVVTCFAFGSQIECNNKSTTTTANLAEDQLILGYKQLDDYLLDHVDTENCLANIEATNGLLRSDEAGDTNLTQTLVEASRQFVALDEIQTSELRCSKRSYEILRSNHQATQNRAHRLKSKLAGPLRRVELILARYTLNHALDCLTEYPRRYGKLIVDNTGLESELKRLKLIDSLISAIIIDHVGQLVVLYDSAAEAAAAAVATSASLAPKRRPRPPPSYRTARKRVQLAILNLSLSLKSAREAKIAKFAIERQLARQNQSSLLLELASKTQTLNEQSSPSSLPPTVSVKQLIHQQLIEPCLEYNQQLGPDLFEPANYDANVLTKALKISLLEDRNLRDYSQAWVRFNFCKILLRDQHVLINNILASIERERKEERQS